MAVNTVIVVGDSNCMLNLLVDRFPHITLTPSPQANALHAICEDWGFDDIWRSLNPFNKEYTFFLLCMSVKPELIIFSCPKLIYAQFCPVI